MNLIRFEHNFHFFSSFIILLNDHSNQCHVCLKTVIAFHSLKLLLKGLLFVSCCQTWLKFQLFETLNVLVCAFRRFVGLNVELNLTLTTFLIMSQCYLVNGEAFLLNSLVVSQIGLNRSVVGFECYLLFNWSITLLTHLIVCLVS